MGRIRNTHNSKVSNGLASGLHLLSKLKAINIEREHVVHVYPKADIIKQVVSHPLE